MKESNKNDIILGLIFLFFVVLTIVVYITYEIWAVQVLSACLGAIITIIVTRLLLSSQSRIDEERDEKRRNAEDKFQRDLEIYNAKLNVYSDFVSKMYEYLSDNEITPIELMELRTMLFGKVGFYAKKDVFENIEEEINSIKNCNDPKMAHVFANIVLILQMDLNPESIPDTDKNRSLIELWNSFEIIISNSNNEDDNLSQNIDDITQHQCTDDIVPHQNVEEKNIVEEIEKLPQQAWHFIMWGDRQLDNLGELSLVEYGENWRTNQVKQVNQGDIIMLFRRGGNGYIGAFKAIGRRIFDFEKEEEEHILFGNESESKVISKSIDNERYENDVKKYDIYGSRDDGATSCANIIVKEIAFVKDGIKNPNPVYRRTISRYDSHYAWRLKKRFQEKGLWLEE